MSPGWAVGSVKRQLTQSLQGPLTLKNAAQQNSEPKGRQGTKAPEGEAQGVPADPPRLRTDQASRAFLVSGQAQQGFTGFFSCESDGVGLAPVRPGIFEA